MRVEIIADAIVAIAAVLREYAKDSPITPTYLNYIRMMHDACEELGKEVQSPVMHLHDLGDIPVETLPQSEST